MNKQYCFLYLSLFLYRGGFLAKTYKNLIVFEGLNASGKATQTRLLVTHLRKKFGQEKVDSIGFPIYNSPTGQMIRNYLVNKADYDAFFISLLYELDRFQVRKKMITSLNAGNWIVLDRYFHSNHTFQKVLANDPKFLPWIKKVESPLPLPKYKIYLDVPIETTIELMSDKKKDWHENDAEYIKKVKEEYDKIIKEGWIIVNCMVDDKMKTPEDIHQEILQKLKL